MQTVTAFDSNGNLVFLQVADETAPLPAGYYSSPGEAFAARGGTPSATPPPVVTQPVAASTTQTVAIGVYDINGNLVTITVPYGSDPSAIPLGYYETPAIATQARALEQSTGEAPTDIEAKQVLYTSTQSSINTLLANPPPASTYVAPTPPVAQGYTPPPATTPETPEDLLAQEYTQAGYTPPDAATLAAIVQGQIAPPVTAPLPGVAQNSLASVTAPSEVSAPAMSGIQINTAPFTIGNDPASGQPIMELIDLDGNLVQWIPNPAGQVGYVMAPKYIMTPPAVNEKRLIGTDSQGNPVFQLIDGSNNLVQWTENRGQTNFVVAPFYVSVGNGARAWGNTGTTATVGTPGATTSGTSSPGNTQTPPASTTSLAQPTIQVGTTPSGDPVYQLVDAVGVVEQWIQAAGGSVDIITVPTYGVMVHDAVTDQPKPTTGTGVVSGGGTAQDLSKPQIQVGTTSAGWAIYQIVDSTGTVKQWIVNPGPPSTLLDSVAATTYGTLYVDAVVKALLGNQTITQTPPASSGSGSGSLILIAAAAVAAWMYFGNRKGAARPAE